MTDTDETTRRIHCNSNRIGFLNSSNGWGSWAANDGSWYSDQSMRAPIFYDSADTSYYVDPNSYSRIYRTSTHLAPSPGVGSSNWVNDFNATPTSSMSFGGDLSSGGPQGTWWFQQNFRHSNASNYWGTQVAWGWEDNANELWQRNVQGGSWSSWVRYINTNNYAGILDARYYTETEINNFFSGATAITGYNKSNWDTAHGWGNHASAGYASSSHNHTYDVNNAWLRDNGDDANVKLYGNSRQMVFRTDGTTEFASGVGNYPFVWMYGGDAASNRRMILNDSGQLWLSNYGWLHDAFVSTTYNSSLNSDSRNSRGVTRLYRRDDDSDFSVQHHWTGSYWWLRGYNGDSFHAEVRVAYADSATSSTIASYAGGLSRYGIIYGDDWNFYNVNGQFIVMSAHGHSGSNRPSGAYTYGSGMSYYNSGSDHYQIYIPENSGNSNGNSQKIHYRSGWNNSWSGWRTLIDLYNSVCYVDGAITASGDITAFSDARVKENVETLEGALDKTLKLRGVSYTRTDIEDKSTKIGVIAQEILEVVPEVVSQDENGMYAVSYGNITALLIEAIKEQQKQIDELKEIINGLTK